MWVQVWLKLTLSLKDSKNTVRLEDHARELLNALQNSSTGASEAHEQLQAGYQRLWTFGALRKFEEIRKRLFRFVLCAFVPLKSSTVAHALRIGIEDNEPLYRKEISIKEIDKLCSNFLSKDDSDHLSWTHDSARDFVVRAILNPGVDLAEDEAKETSMKSNHLLVANTFIAVMRVSDHPVWKELDLDPSQWKLGSYVISEQDKEKRELIRNAPSSLEYLCTYGWRHCIYAADKHVIFDPLWTRTLRELILRHKTAFALWWQLWCNFGSWIPEEILGDYAGERVILVSHVLAFSNLEADSVSNVQFEKAAKVPPEPNFGEDLLESLVQHAACKSINGANALHVACIANNGSILNLMLQAILHRHGGVSRVFELLEEEYESKTPFAWALKSKPLFLKLRSGSQRRFSTVETLLRFENNHLRPNGCDQSGNPALSLCLWLHRIPSDLSIPFLMRAALQYDESQVIRLLNIHKPCNIDFRTKYNQETALHYAARRGVIKLVKLLVEECHATVDISYIFGETPLDVARINLGFLPRKNYLPKRFTENREGKPEHDRVIEYLESLNQKTKA